MFMEIAQKKTKENLCHRKFVFLSDLFISIPAEVFKMGEFLIHRSKIFFKLYND